MQTTIQKAKVKRSTSTVVREFQIAGSYFKSWVSDARTLPRLEAVLVTRRGKRGIIWEFCAKEAIRLGLTPLPPKRIEYGSFEGPRSTVRITVERIGA